MNNITDTLICGVCKGKKIVDSYDGKPKLCPKCQGTGNLQENFDKNKKQLLKG